jgi:hypothetical protein
MISLKIDYNQYNFYNKPGTWEFVILHYVINIHPEMVMNSGLDNPMEYFLRIFNSKERIDDQSIQNEINDILQYDALLKEKNWYNWLLSLGQKPKVVPKAILQLVIYKALFIEEEVKKDFNTLILEEGSNRNFEPLFKVTADGPGLVFDFFCDTIYIDEFDLFCNDRQDLEYSDLTRIELFDAFINSNSIKKLNGIGLDKSYDFSLFIKFPDDYNIQIDEEIKKLKKYLKERDSYWDKQYNSMLEFEDEQERLATKYDDFDGSIPKLYKNGAFDDDPSASWNID